MEAVIELLEMVGIVIVIFAGGLLFARVSGYGKYYDKMLYGEESDKCIMYKKKNEKMKEQ